MSRHPQNDAVKQAAKEREAEIKPTPVLRESFDNMQKRVQNDTDRNGTSETRKGKEDKTPEFQSSVDAEFRARYDASEKQKEEDIKQLKKDSDGKPKI